MSIKEPKDVIIIAYIEKLKMLALENETSINKVLEYLINEKYIENEKEF